MHECNLRPANETVGNAGRSSAGVGACEERGGAMSEQVNVPDDLKELLNIASALKAEQEKIKSTALWVGIHELHSFCVTFTPNTCIALIERIGKLEAEVDRLREVLTIIGCSRMSPLEYVETARAALKRQKGA
jgi:hypothetical protein